MDEATGCRPLFSYEMEDPDFSWLINKFLESRPEFRIVEAPCLPIVLIQGCMAAPDTKSVGELSDPMLLEDLADVDEEHPEG